MLGNRFLLMIDRHKEVRLFDLWKHLECDYDDVLVQIFVVYLGETIESVLAVNNPSRPVPIWQVKVTELDARILFVHYLVKPDIPYKVDKQVGGKIAAILDELTDVAQAGLTDESLVGGSTFRIIQGSVVYERYFQQMTRGCSKAVECSAAELAFDGGDRFARQFWYWLILQELRKELVSCSLTEMFNDLSIIPEFTLGNDVNVLTYRSLFVGSGPENVLGDEQPDHLQLLVLAIVLEDCFDMGPFRFANSSMSSADSGD